VSDGHARVAVIGGGIAGSFAAYFGAQVGARVTLVERDHVGGHASGNNPGGLNPLYGVGIPGPLAALALESFRLHESCARDGRIPVAPEPKRRLNLAVDDADLDALRRLKSVYDETPGFSATWLSGRELHEREPRLAPSIAHGLLAEGDLHVDAARYTAAVAAAAVERGAAIRQALVTGIVRDGSHAVAVHTEAGPVACDAVVVATGAWSEEPAGWLGVPLPIAPVKGELLLAELPRGAVGLDLAWNMVAIYRVDAARVMIGGTETDSGFDERCTARARHGLLEEANRIVPGMTDAEVVGHFAGLRPVTADGMPIVGMAPGFENVCLALGGGRKGMLFGPAMGKAAVDLLLDGSTAISIAACSPERFAVAQS
jgi:glycine oxidase